MARQAMRQLNPQGIQANHLAVQYECKFTPRVLHTGQHGQHIPIQVFDYQSRQVRLLTLLPSRQKDAQIQVEIETIAFPTPIDYEALSYTWGDQLVKHKVNADGGTLEVSQNVHDALCHLRHADRPRTLWVDAICIDQANVLERNHQVHLMRDIYSNSSRVVVWLGKSDDDIEAAMKYMRDTPDAWKLPERREKHLSGLSKLYSNPWWQRMWVVQEVAVAMHDPLVMCGYECAPWKILTKTLFWMHWEDLLPGMSIPLSGFMSHTSFSSFRNNATGERKTWARDDLSRLLRNTRTRHASDLHDHIFALLGMFSEQESDDPLFEVDYTKPPRIAYQHAMVSVCNSQKDLSWLAWAARGDVQTIVPSWCVDFSSMTWESEAEVRQWEVVRRHPKGFMASLGRDMQELVHDPLAGTLQISGTRIGVVDSICMAATAAVPTAVVPTAQRSRLASWRGEAKSIMFRWAGRTLQEAMLALLQLAHPALAKRLGPAEASRRIAQGDVWRTIAYSDDDDVYFSAVAGFGRKSDSFAWLETLARGMFPQHGVLSVGWKDKLPAMPGIHDFMHTKLPILFQLACRASRCCYFSTGNGYIGMAGHLIRRGDVLSILYGCGYPAVLRPQADGSYKLVTLTYTNDVMKGEFVADGTTVADEEFLIR